MNHDLANRMSPSPRRRTHRLTPWALPLLALLTACQGSMDPAPSTDPATPTLTPASPEEAGFDADQLDAAVDLYRTRVENGRLMGVVLLVARDGKVVVHEALGWRDRENNLPMKENTIFRMASNTKAVVATAALILAEAGTLELDDPVSEHIPAFADGEMAKVTVRQLLANGGGLPRGPILLPDAGPDSDLAREAERFAQELTLESEPGTRYGYSNAGYNVLGGVIEAAAGRNLEDVLTERIYEPLGMTDTNNHESNSDPHRMAKVYRGGGNIRTVVWAPGDDPSFPIVRASGGMNSTARDYAAFLQTWLNGGAYGSVRLLSEESVEEGAQVQSPTGEYGYGWRVAGNGRLSHGGSDGTWVWIDPEEGIIGLVLTQHPGAPNPRTEFRDRVRDALMGAP